MVRPKSEADPVTSTPASPPLESCTASAVNASVSIRGNPPFVKAEEAADEDMSAGAEAAVIQSVHLLRYVFCHKLLLLPACLRKFLPKLDRGTKKMRGVSPQNRR